MTGDEIRVISFVLNKFHEFNAFNNKNLCHFCTILFQNWQYYVKFMSSYNKIKINKLILWVIHIIHDVGTILLRNVADLLLSGILLLRRFAEAESPMRIDMQIDWRGGEAAKKMAGRDYFLSYEN